MRERAGWVGEGKERQYEIHWTCSAQLHRESSCEIRRGQLCALPLKANRKSYFLLRPGGASGGRAIKRERSDQRHFSKYRLSMYPSRPYHCAPPTRNNPRFGGPSKASSAPRRFPTRKRRFRGEKFTGTSMGAYQRWREREGARQREGGEKEENWPHSC